LLDLQIVEDAQTPIYQRIADAVCEAVVEGRLSPGEKLPAHMGLARRLGVSPLTVSRGYALLRSRGIVRQRRGSGTYVELNAIDRASRTEGRQISTLWVPIGETVISRCKRETLFIVTDVLDGVREILSDGPTKYNFVKGLTRDDMPEIGDKDAVLAVSPRYIDNEYATELKFRGVPMVSVNNSDPYPPTMPHIRYDRMQSSRLACRHLIDCGYKRIGFIGVKTSTEQTIPPKYFTYTSMMHEAGLDVCARYVRDVPSTLGKAYAAARSLVEAGDLPEAFFIDTDYKAMEAVCAFHDAGIRVPQDLGVACYDNVPESATFDPPLTTVRVPRREIGRRAARLLVNWPTDGSVPDSVILHSELLVRQSTCIQGHEETP